MNAVGIFVMFGAVEFFYYVKRKQETRFKYNARFPSEHPSDVFWFKSQNIDNFLRTYLSSIPLWTLCQVVILWAWANSWGNWVEWETYWPWLIVLTLLVPAIHEVHFFFRPSPDPHAAALQMGAFGASQLDQSEPVVVSVDASG